MNKGWQKNSWITATLFFVLGVTGILQAYIYSQEQPEAVFFVLTLVASSIFFIISLPLLVGFVMSVRRARRLGVELEMVRPFVVTAPVLS
jgi:hypothetical protein